MLVLKIIGIVLLSILALILLILALVLFVPIRYEATVFADGTDLEKLKAQAKAHWLLHLVDIGAVFKEKQFKLEGRVAFFKLFGEKKEKEDRTPKKSKEKQKKESQAVTTKTEKHKEEAKAETKEEIKAEEPKVEEFKAEEPKADEVEAEATKAEETGTEEAKAVEVESEKTATAPAEKVEKSQKNKKKKEKKPRKEKKKKDKKTKKPKNPNSFVNRLKRLYGKREKVLRVYEKEEKNLKLALRRTGRLLKKILPRKSLGYVEFGMEDPASTGKILGYVSALYAMTGPLVNLYPDFTEQKLKADVKIKGHFSLISIGIYILQVPLNKELRRAWKYLKKLSLEEEK